MAALHWHLLLLLFLMQPLLELGPVIYVMVLIVEITSRVIVL
jgi:hypothetical protein